MGWNNASETKKFLRRLEREEKEYRAAGMTDEQITEIQAFDWEQFRSDRRYRMHTQEFALNDFDEDKDGDEGKSPLFDKFLEQFSYTMEVKFTREGRYAWFLIIQRHIKAMRYWFGRNANYYESGYTYDDVWVSPKNIRIILVRS